MLNTSLVFSIRYHKPISIGPLVFATKSDCYNIFNLSAVKISQIHGVSNLRFSSIRKRSPTSFAYICITWHFAKCVYPVLPNSKTQRICNEDFHSPWLSDFAALLTPAAFLRTCHHSWIDCSWQRYQFQAKLKTAWWTFHLKRQPLWSHALVWHECLPDTREMILLARNWSWQSQLLQKGECLWNKCHWIIFYEYLTC